MINFGNPPSYFDQLLVNFRTWLVRNYQALLVSGTNIKTINGSSVLGSGDLTVSAAGFTLVDNMTGGTSSTATLVTGVTGEVITYSKRLTLAANTNGYNFFRGNVDGTLKIQTQVKKASDVNDVRMNVYINTANNLTGALQLATTGPFGSDGGAFLTFKRTLTAYNRVVVLQDPTIDSITDETYDPTYAQASITPYATGYSGDIFLIFTILTSNTATATNVQSSHVVLYS